MDEISLAPLLDSRVRDSYRGEFRDEIFDVQFSVEILSRFPLLERNEGIRGRAAGIPLPFLRNFCRPLLNGLELVPGSGRGN